jgi:Mut7-C ubiquitin
MVRQRTIEPVVYRCATSKGIIEALGVQLIEVDLMLAAGESV